MTDTYKILIENIIGQKATQMGNIDTSKAFESVTNSLILDKYDLTVDDIDAGITDGSGDGQIDSMYIIVNGNPLSENEDDDEDMIPSKGPLDIDIVMIQSKNTDSFEENPLKMIRTTVSDLIDLKRDYSNKLNQYSSILQEKFGVARKTLMASAGRTANIKVRVFYATKARTSNIHANVKLTAEALKNDLASLAASQDVTINFLGAEELIALSRQIKTQQRTLEVEQSLSSDNGDSYACLVTIESLIKFLSDPNGALVRALFDANVRDFLGKTEVNDAIRSTLESMNEEDFWWFNNGVTVITSDIDQKGKRLVLTDALVVNGLQTSNVLYSFMTDTSVSDEIKNKCNKKIVLLKIIVPPSEKIRDEIIKATNSQTNIPKPYLRGMDLVHRNIEDHLKQYNLFYERRKNQYKNAGKNRSSIITLTEAAQSFMSGFLFRGADARARPNSLLKSDDDYKKLFSETYHLDSFKNVIMTKRAIMGELLQMYSGSGVAFRNDIIYHVLSYVSQKRFHSLTHAVNGWRHLTIEIPELRNDIQTICDLFTAEGGTDKIAKSPGFNQRVANAAIEARNAGTPT